MGFEVVDRGDREWEVPEAQRALWPEVSGNDINGLGERYVRRANIVYWPNRNDTSSIPFGPLVDYFQSNQSKYAPDVTAAFTDWPNRAPRKLDPVAADGAEDTAESWTNRVKSFALADEADLVGVTRLDPNWFFQESEQADLPWVVVIGVVMDWQRFSQVPPTPKNSISALEVGEIYNQVDRAAGTLANWIRAQGWNAEKQGGPASGEMLLIPAAVSAGLGELGKHGSLINKEHGSIIRLSCVRTDLPLIPNQPEIFGADDFCTHCQVCRKACPPDAIHDDKQWVRGEKKWYVDFDKCVPYFNETFACGICLAVCPWSRPGTAPRLAEKMTRRRARLAAESEAET